MVAEPAWIEPLQRLGLALAIGFLVGVERGWKQREEPEGGRAAGLRTFTLAGVLGGVSGLSLALAGPILVSAIVLVFGATFTAFQLRQAVEDDDNSATSAIAGLVVFGLGLYAAIGSQTVAAAGGVATALILAFKEALHNWVRSLTWKEIRSALLILAATLIALPILPRGAIDPWGVIEPRSLWTLTILIAGASFLGYVALRAVGPRSGLLLSSLAGAIVSSTAVTLDLARRVRNDETTANVASIAATLATLVSLARAAALSAVMSVDLSAALAPALAAGGAICVVGVVLLRRLESATGESGARTEMRSPLDLLSVARTAAVLCGVIVLANVISRTFGTAGLTAFSAAAGMADVDAVTLAVGRLVGTGLPISQAADAILIAVLADQVLKVIAAALIGNMRFGLRFGSVMAATVIAGGAAYFGWNAVN